MTDSTLHSPLYERLRGSGPPLGAVAEGAIVAALDADLATALAVDRATRDRLVIFDPASAPLLRPLVAAADVAPWHVGGADRWIVAVPARLAATLGRHPALARHLDALAPPSPQAGPLWWALPDDLAAPPPRLLIAGEPPAVAWDDTAAVVGGPTSVIAPADPYWLALLGSQPGRALLADGVPATAIPVPAAPAPAQAGLGGLALSAATLARQIDELRRGVLRRLVADFGPPGIYPGPLLSRWWTLDFAELHEAVRGELRNDIPERYRPTWAQIHADERAVHAGATARLAELERAIDAQVGALYGL